MVINTDIPMTTDAGALLKLMTWLSPVFPTGGFAYSHGLEAAVADGKVTNRETLLEWITALLLNGSIRNDCLLLGEAARVADDADALVECALLAEALAGSQERHLETTAQGAALLRAASEWMADLNLPENCPFPVVIGALAAKNQVDTQSARTAFLQAFVSNQIQAALRLTKLDQQNGTWVQKQAEPNILEIVRKAEHASLRDLGSATIAAEIAAMHHEVMPTRIFRS